MPLACRDNLTTNSNVITTIHLLFRLLIPLIFQKVFGVKKLQNNAIVPDSDYFESGTILHFINNHNPVSDSHLLQ